MALSTSFVVLPGSSRRRAFRSHKTWPAHFCLRVRQALRAAVTASLDFREYSAIHSPEATSQLYVSQLKNLVEARRRYGARLANSWARCNASCPAHHRTGYVEQPVLTSLCCMSLCVAVAMAVSTCACACACACAWLCVCVCNFRTDRALQAVLDLPHHDAALWNEMECQQCRETKYNARHGALCGVCRAFSLALEYRKAAVELAGTQNEWSRGLDGAPSQAVLEHADTSKYSYGGLSSVLAATKELLARPSIVCVCLCVPVRVRARVHRVLSAATQLSRVLVPTCSLDVTARIPYLAQGTDSNADGRA